MKFLTVSTIALLAAGCATTGEPSEIPPGESCNAQPAQALIGQKTSVELGGRILELTGATALRWGPPGAVFTMDYRSDRVNVMYDQQMTVTEITCG